MASDESEVHTSIGNEDRAGKLGTLGWGLFFIWIGIVFLANLEAWLALLGIGAIVLIMQALRASGGLGTERFWIVVGLLFVLAGVWDLVGTDLPLLPILLILAGVALVLSMFRRG